MFNINWLLFPVFMICGLSDGTKLWKCNSVGDSAATQNIRYLASIFQGYSSTTDHITGSIKFRRAVRLQTLLNREHEIPFRRGLPKPREQWARGRAGKGDSDNSCLGERFCHIPVMEGILTLLNREEDLSRSLYQLVMINHDLAVKPTPMWS